MSLDDRHVVWEYEVHPLDAGGYRGGAASPEILAETLNLANAEGWEVVSTLTVETSSASTQTLALFKRRAR